MVRSSRKDVKEKIQLANRMLARPIFEYKARHASRRSLKTLFNNRLIKKRSKGEYVFTGIAQELVETFDRLLLNELKEFKSREKTFPNCVDKETILRSGYRKNFGPIVQLSSQKNKSLTDQVYLPAACLPCYAQLEKTQITSPLSVITTRNQIHRREPRYPNVFVMNEFDMREFVFIGGKNEVRDALDKSMDIIKQLAQKLDLTFTLNLSADIFYGESVEEKTLFQLLNKSKIELRALSQDLKEYIPIASANFHGTHFSKEFKIHRKKELVQSGCVAFGLQRWALIFLNIYGARKNQWPQHIQKILK